MRLPTIEMIEKFRDRIAEEDHIPKITFQGQTIYRKDGTSMDSEDLENMTNEEILERCLNLPSPKIPYGVDYWIKQKGEIE